MDAAMGLMGVCRCNEKADIFSYGVVLWEIITQETPQRGTLRDIRVCIFSLDFCSSLFMSFIFQSVWAHLHCCWCTLQRCSLHD